MWKHEKLFWRCNTISELMINEQIRDKEIRLIGENGEQLGIMSAREAMKLAEEAELDLVKIAPTAKPPVCKIIDYGKYRYELARKEKEAKKKQKVVELKEIRLSPNIDLNDLKRFNDENGHAAGDTALCTIVACIQNILPRGCHLYRTGGDEFMILCSRVSKDDVPALIDHMRRELSKTLYCCAIGFATPDADEDFEHICSIADAAMYANKKQLKGEDTIR